MVSKTPTKSPSQSNSTTPSPYSTIKSKIKKKTHSTKNSKRLSPSPIKSLAATFDRSVRSCRRKLFRIFAKLTIYNSKIPRGFRRRLEPSSPSPPPALPSATALPPLLSPSKKTIFFDLDETLVHSVSEPPTKRYDFAVYPSIAGRVVPFYVIKRPGADKLLKAAAAGFEVVVFTAGLKEYASLVLDQLDPNGQLITHRLYRDACKETDGKFVKDLGVTGRALDRSAIVDDNPNAYVNHPENAVPITPFLDDLKDRELEKLLKFFEIAAGFDDMRDAVAYYRTEYGDKNCVTVA